MAFLQSPNPPLDQLALFQLPLAHAAAQTAQVANQAAQPAPAHGPLLLHPTRAAAEHIHFVGSRDELDLHGFGDFLPVALQELLFVSLELAFGRAHQIVCPALTQQFQVLLADDPSVKDPEAAGFPELRLDRVEDVFERRAIQPVAGEDFVSEREALGRHDEGQHQLFAIGPVIAAVTAPGFGHGLHVALEIGAGQIVEQEIKGRAEQILPPLRQVLFEGGLVDE
jgi:hypothetical protein